MYLLCFDKLYVRNLYIFPHRKDVVLGVVIAVLSCVPLFATPWTVARQAPLSMGFSRQERWSVLPFPTLGDLPDPGIEPAFLASPALVGIFLIAMPPGKPPSA